MSTSFPPSGPRHLRNGGLFHQGQVGGLEHAQHGLPDGLVATKLLLQLLAHADDFYEHFISAIGPILSAINDGELQKKFLGTYQKVAFRFSLTNCSKLFLRVRRSLWTLDRSLLRLSSFWLLWETSS